MNRTWLPAVDAAKYLRLRSTKTLYSLAGRKQLPAGSVLRIGKQLRFDVDLIEKELAK